MLLQIWMRIKEGSVRKLTDIRFFIEYISLNLSSFVR